VREDQFDYVTPDSIQNSRTLVWNDYHAFMVEAQKIYDELVESGIKPEDARFILPNACCTEIVMSCNMREWRHIFKERLSSAAQWEIREMCQEILRIIKPIAPTIFEDFEIDLKSEKEVE
jgi:thymidylate synthase (FAD)